MPDKIFCLMGPTASGKTALACELAKVFPFEIVSVDSALIYKNMDIGTAKPDAALLEKAPHHLINIINPNETYSVAKFCEDAIAICRDLLARGKIPLLVGGTMMYFKALQDGLAVLPEADFEVREKLSAEASIRGWGALHNELLRVDPGSAAKIHPHDTQRIQRALEVFRVTGKPLSLLLKETHQSPFEHVNLLLIPDDRKWLHQRIEERFKEMLDHHFLQEVKTLMTEWEMQDSSPAMRTVGYRQAIAHLNGEASFDEFVAKGIAATRQLAKRQITWLRHWENGIIFKPEHINILGELVASVQQIIDNSASN